MAVTVSLNLDYYRFRVPGTDINSDEHRHLRHSISSNQQFVPQHSHSSV